MDNVLALAKTLGHDTLWSLAIGIFLSGAIATTALILRRNPHFTLVDAILCVIGAKEFEKSFTIYLSVALTIIASLAVGSLAHSSR